MSPAERDGQRTESDVAARQLGLITQKQALRLGLSRSTIGRRAQSGAWVRILPGVYRIAAVPVTERQSALAAVLWGGEGAVLSHASAGAIWRLDGVQASGYELWVPRNNAPPSSRVTVHYGTVDAIDIRMREGIRVTSPARTLLDLAGVLDAEGLQAAGESALHRGLTTPNMVAKRLGALGGKGRPGSGALRAWLADRGSGPAMESRLEVRIWMLLRGAGLRPTRQYDVSYDGQAYRLDFAWPALRVAVEADGYEAHGGRRSFERDHARFAVLAAHGWYVVPVTWRQVTERRAWVLDQVIGALHSAAA
jgi:very-short-patch-repair endonuclease